MEKDKSGFQDNAQIAKVIIVEKEQCIYDSSFMIDEYNVLLNSINVKRVDEKTGKIYESEFSINFSINKFGERYYPVIHIKTNSTSKMKYLIRYKYLTDRFTYIIKPDDYMKCIS
jgi:hypothetical protein